MVEAGALIRAGAEKLKDVAERPHSEARLLLAHVLNCSVSELIIHSERPVSSEQAGEYEKYVRLRADAVPMAYITGKKEFYGLEFAVNPGVLIPRADTETLVSYVLQQDAKTMLDLCTGSGCIAVACAKNSPCLRCVAVDISETALQTARENAARNGVGGQIDFIHGDLLDEGFEIGAKFDLIASNPPYIPAGDIDGLMPDVRDHEPRLALDGGENGLLFYEKICVFAEKTLHFGGILAMEIGMGQYEAVQRLMQPHFDRIGFMTDLAGIRRVIFGELKKTIDTQHHFVIK